MFFSRYGTPPTLAEPLAVAGHAIGAATDVAHGDRALPGTAGGGSRAVNGAFELPFQLRGRLVVDRGDCPDDASANRDYCRCRLWE